MDANVLIYAVSAGSTNHDRARAWLERALAGNETVGFAWTVLLAFLRLATSRAVFDRPLTPDQAIDVVRIWLASPSAAVVEPGPRHLGSMAALLADAGAAGNLVSDAHLAALAVETNAVLVSFDTDFARFAGLRWEPPSG